MIAMDMRDELIHKLTDALSLAIESETQVVYILVEMRKLLDGDLQGSAFPTFRLMCNWAMHAELTNKSVQDNLVFIEGILGPWLEDKAVPTSEQEKAAVVLSLVSAREEFLDIIRDKEINTLIPHVFLPEWWSTFLKQYVGLTRDCPWQVAAKNITAKTLKSATMKRGELIPVTDDPDIAHRFRIHWEFERVDGVKRAYAVDCNIQANASEQFGSAKRRIELPGVKNYS